MSKILLKMESPLVALGKSLNNNYKESLPYISGDKVRAAFAKYILQNCPIYEVNRKEEVSTNEFKYNWVFYRNRKECEGCPLSDTCKNFSSMKFSFFYPKGTDILPFTAMKCKYDKEHGFRDILIREDEMKCKKCIKENNLGKKDDIKNNKHIEEKSKSPIGRMEAAYGFRKGNKAFNINKVIYTKNAINRYTKASKEGALYTIVAVKNDYFAGEIEGVEILLKAMEAIDGKEKAIRIGSYTSVGMGLFKVESCDENSENDNLLDKLREFNNRIKRQSFDEDYNIDLNYIPILFKSDGKLGLEKINITTYLTDDEYREKWKGILEKDVNFEFEVERVYTETENYRGYDLSKGINDAREDIVVLNKMGTTILLKTKEKLENIVEALNKFQIEGIGFERENGFGKIEICNELHLKGEIYE